MIYRPSQELLQYCTEALQKNSMGQRTDKGTNGNANHQFAGLVCENVVRKLTGYPYNNATSGFDGGWDIVYNDLRTDIKSTILYQKPTLLDQFHVPKIQLKYNTQAYLFCAYIPNDNIVYTCGYIEKDIFLAISKIVKRGQYHEEPCGRTYTARYTSHYVINNDLKKLTFNK